MTSPTPSAKNLGVAGVSHRRNRSGSEGVQGSARYVDYLERQVADLLVQLQGYTSPASGVSHAVKMRRLSSEARSLRNEVMDWEAKFNIRVKDEVETRAAQDMTLRGKIRALEERLEEEQERRRDVEVELEEEKEKVRDLKGLEEENRRLEFKVEALSGLLAESTRMQTGRSASSAPSSIVGSRSESAVFGERCEEISTVGTTPVESRRGSIEGPLSCGSSPGRGMEDYGITDPIEHVLSTIAFCESESNAHTALSTAPPTPISPLPDSFGPSLRSRRMRKFPSGSSAPKTLILPSAAVVPSTSTSPTLPTIRTFFNMPIADPSSMCASTRPSSSCSTVTSQFHTTVSQVNLGHGPTRPILATQNSLFAELARAENESVSDTEADAAPAPVSGVGTPAPPSPALSDTFTLVTDAMSNPTPLIVKAVAMVGMGIRSPTGTFLSARRSAMDMLSGVVGKGVERVSRRRAKLLREARRRKDDVVEGRVRRCECTCPHTVEKEKVNDRPTSAGEVSLALARSVPRVAQAEDAVENVWLWVRFVVALVVALGVAVKEGPAVVLAVDGVDYDHVDEEERETAIRTLSGKGKGKVVVKGKVEREETRAEKMRREWKGMGDERLRLWERERSGSVGVHVGDGRRKAMEW